MVQAKKAATKAKKAAPRKMAAKIELPKKVVEEPTESATETMDESMTEADSQLTPKDRCLAKLANCTSPRSYTILERVVRRQNQDQVRYHTSREEKDGAKTLTISTHFHEHHLTIPNLTLSTHDAKNLAADVLLKTIYPDEHPAQVETEYPHDLVVDKAWWTEKIAKHSEIMKKRLEQRQKQINGNDKLDDAEKTRQCAFWQGRMTPTTDLPDYAEMIEEFQRAYSEILIATCLLNGMTLTKEYSKEQGGETTKIEDIPSVVNELTQEDGVTYTVKMSVSPADKDECLVYEATSDNFCDARSAAAHACLTQMIEDGMITDFVFSMQKARKMLKERKDKANTGKKEKADKRKKNKTSPVKKNNKNDKTPKKQNGKTPVKNGKAPVNNKAKSDKKPTPNGKMNGKPQAKTMNGKRENGRNAQNKTSVQNGGKFVKKDGLKVTINRARPSGAPQQRIYRQTPQPVQAGGYYGAPPAQQPVYQQQRAYQPQPQSGYQPQQPMYQPGTQMMMPCVAGPDGRMMLMPAQPQYVHQPAHQGPPMQPPRAHQGPPAQRPQMNQQRSWQKPGRIQQPRTTNNRPAPARNQPKKKFDSKPVKATGKPKVQTNRQKRNAAKAKVAK